MEKLKKLSNHQLFTLCLYRVTKNDPSLDKKSMLKDIMAKVEEHPCGVLGYLIKPGELLFKSVDFSELYIIAIEFNEKMSRNKALSDCYAVCKEVIE